MMTSQNLTSVINHEFVIITWTSYHKMPESLCRICPIVPLQSVTELQLFHCQVGCKLLQRNGQNAEDIYQAESPPNMAMHKTRARTATRKLQFKRTKR